jgi:putative helicase MOV10L1/helicase MOV-10
MADQPWQAFTRLAKSSAIRIQEPNSEMQPAPVVQKAAITFPSSIRPTNKDSSARDTHNSSANAKHSQKKELEENHVDVRAFNIYARPFIPQVFTIINKLPGQTIDTQPTKRIHFGAYVNSFVGSGILQPFPPPIEQPINVAPDTISHTHYELYFRCHLEAEIKSQQQENELYSLYGHEVTISQDSAQTECTFAVPGLRENNPYIEEDDLIQLRQLRYDQQGRLLGMEHWMARGRAAGFLAAGWTGIIYNARASVVQRKQEQLAIRICGFMAQKMNFTTQSSQFHFKFNVQFPVPMDRYLPSKKSSEQSISYPSRLL